MNRRMNLRRDSQGAITGRCRREDCNGARDGDIGLSWIRSLSAQPVCSTILLRVVEDSTRGRVVTSGSDRESRLTNVGGAKSRFT